MKSLEINDSNILYISQFGSYGTDEWVKNISDIDIGVVVNSLENLDFELEDKLIAYFKKVYDYDIINITIVKYDLEDKLTRNILCGKTLYSKLNEKDIKRLCLYIERTVQYQRNYYELGKLEKLKIEVENLW